MDTNLYFSKETVTMKKIPKSLEFLNKKKVILTMEEVAKGYFFKNANF